MAFALEGVRVLDLSRSLPGALATMIMADNGADVVKLEAPDGDPTRRHYAAPMWHRGKRSVVADLKTAAGKDLLGRLAERADVLLHTFRPGVAERLGAGYAALAERNPGLVYCAISGFGPRGPYAHYKAYEGVLHARSGVMQGFAGLPTRAGPAYAANPLASYGASQMALQGILAALRVRVGAPANREGEGHPLALTVGARGTRLRVDGSGRGQRIDTSLLQGRMTYDMVNWAVAQMIARYPQAFEGAPRVASSTALSPMFLTFLMARTKDGIWVQFTNAQVFQFRAFMECIGLLHLMDDPWYKGIPNVEDDDARFRLWSILLRQIAEKSFDEWMEIFLANPNVSVERLRTTNEAMDHPQVRHNGHVVAVEDLDLGPTEQVGPLVTFEKTPSRVTGPMPRLGEHTVIVAAEWASGRGGEREIPPLTPSPARPLRGPLEDITIVDVATFYAGPFGTALLADMGARVIKIEPIEGDPWRYLLYPPETCALKAIQGKESVALDLKQPEAQAIVHRLVDSADVFLHNFRPGVEKKLGIDYATLKAIKPDLIYVYASAYGSDGPFALRPAYAPTAEAIAGCAINQAGEGYPPAPDAALTHEQVCDAALWMFIANKSEADNTAAISVATAILLALRHRDGVPARGSGEGQYAMTTMIAANAYALSDDFIRYAGKPAHKLADRQLLGLGALRRLYEASEGWVYLEVHTDAEWSALQAALGLPSDPRFASAAGRAEHDGALAEALAAAFRTRPAAEWERALTAVDVGCVRADGGAFPQFTVMNPLMQELGLVTPVDHPSLGDYVRHGPAVTFSLTPAMAGPAPLVGQHSRAVLTEFGYDAATIDDLRARKVLRTHES
jgi:crotonobetainyl-CoA:carnitine CoA-transferase CaiB-like acyl-CoA transferase